MGKQIATLVVTYNRLALLQECIGAIRSQSYQDFDIIVINNGSTDGTLEWLSTQNDIITITQDNQGGAGGFHTGLKYAVENSYKYTWLMDDDTIPTKCALEELIDSIFTLTDWGFICSKVVDSRGRTCNYPTIDNKTCANGEFKWLEQTDKHLIGIRCATFVSVLVNNKYVCELGLPYRSFFIWGDDIEYTHRFSDSHECFIAVKSLVLHKRVQESVLSIFTETDPKRVDNFFYAYRNKIFLTSIRSKSKAAIWWILSMVDCIKLLIKGEFHKSYIIGKSILSVLYFNPKKEFPK